MENKITAGIWFVFIGLILLLSNLAIIDFNVWATLKYWPLLVVILGINLMVQNKAYSTYIKIGCNVIFLSWILYVGLSTQSTDWRETIFNNRTTTWTDGDDTHKLVSTVSSPYDSTQRTAKFELNGGAGSFNLQADGTEQLVEAISPDKRIGLYLETETSSKPQKVTINAKPVGKSRKKTGTVNINLHRDILWDLELNYGAATINGDLSSTSFNKLEINTGASTLRLKLGSPKIELAKVDIATGASTINLQIPKQAAIMVKYTSILSSNSFDGFESNSNGVAKTAGYDQATHKYEINIEGAANTFSISRY